MIQPVANGIGQIWDQGNNRFGAVPKIEAKQNTVFPTGDSLPETGSPDPDAGDRVDNEISPVEQVKGAVKNLKMGEL